MTSKNIYYIYAYIRSKDSMTAKAGTPYYIGKGKGKRAWAVEHTIPLPKNKSKIIIMESGLTDLGALALERRYIKWWGRVDTNSGILRNKTDGGDGGSGKIVSDLTRKKLSEATKKSAKNRPPMSQAHKDAISRGNRRIGSPGEKHPFYGKKRPEHSQFMKDFYKNNPKPIISEETRMKRRNAQLGKIASPETKAKMSATRKGKNWNPNSVKSIRCVETGLEFASITAAAMWVRANTNFVKAVYTNISTSAQSLGKKRAYGFTWEWPEAKSGTIH